MGALYWLVILIIPILASLNVNMTYKKYSRINNARGWTADQVARKILDSNGLYNIRIEHIPGNLTDHFDPTAGVIRLSDSVYGKSSVAAIGVAAHECGHAVQHAENYQPIVLRSKLVPITNFCSKIYYIIILLGILLAFNRFLIYVGIFLFLAVVVFQLVTLPVEFDASARALKTLENESILERDENDQAAKVLRAAALTYVAALVTTLMQLIRYLNLVRRN